ncbi:hypothetical protein ALQ02_200009 [Pseudomonas savastanoi pv. phaseolicola]|nr:hypothetical protein ALQ02_200009 [Pseudomonas savastanoi pv. phaseolicola]
MEYFLRSPQDVPVYANSGVGLAWQTLQPKINELKYSRARGVTRQRPPTAGSRIDSAHRRSELNDPLTAT